MENLVKEYFELKETYYNDKQTVVEFMNDHGFNVSMDDNEFINDFLTTFSIGASVKYGGKLKDFDIL